MKLSIELKIESEADYQAICTAIDMLTTIRENNRNKYSNTFISKELSEQIEKAMSESPTYVVYAPDYDLPIGKQKNTSTLTSAVMSDPSSYMDVTSKDFIFVSKK